MRSIGPLARTMAVVALVVLLVCLSGIQRMLLNDVGTLEKGYYGLAMNAYATQAAIKALEKRVVALEGQVEALKGRIRTYTATASWYGPGFHGRTTADGSEYDQMAFTLAHKTMPFGTILIIEYRGKRVPAMVTDRGPYIDGRDFDLSLGLAQRLGVVEKGVVQVTVYEVTP